jgi:hypothetical protein
MVVDNSNEFFGGKRAIDLYVKGKIESPLLFTPSHWARRDSPDDSKAHAYSHNVSSFGLVLSPVCVGLPSVIDLTNPCSWK